MSTKNKKIYKKKNDGSLELVGYLPTEDVPSRVDNVESSINNLNNAVADRYTKGETDRKLDEKLSIITSSSKYSFDGGGRYRFCKIATITVKQSWSNRPIIFECIGRGMDSRQIISIRPSGSPEATGTAFEKITKTTNDLVWALKDEGNGVGSLYVMLAEVWGNVQVLRVSYYGFVNVEMKMEGCDGFPEGSILAKNVITALLADMATDIKYIPGTRFRTNKFVDSLTKNLFGEDTSNSGHSRITTVRADYEAGVPDGIGIPGGCGTGLAWYSTVDTGGLLSTSLGDYAFGKSATIGNIRGNGLEWWRYLVLSENGSNIADQHVAYANSSGTAAICESTALLTAEGTNLGAKIRTQYTTGTPGGSVTYHQATWYVLGNDGDTYNFSKMITTDNFGTNMTEALKNTKVEHTTRSDYTTYLDNGNNDSTSIPISYDNDNGTSLKYTSYPKLTISYVTGYGVLEGNVYNHGSFQLAVSDHLNGMIYVRSVAKDGSAPAWVKLLTDGDVINSLDSDIINRPLSAYQGKVMSGKITSINSSIASINSKFSGYQPKLNSETGATMQWLSFKNGSSYSISGIWCGSVELRLNGSVGSNASSNFTIASSYESSFSNGNWYICVSPIKGGYVDTMAYGAEYLDNNAYGGKIWARRVLSAADTTYTFNIIAIRLY